jgi:hypothetical protein
MISTILFFICLTLTVPLLIALMESNRKELDVYDEGFWTLARALMGGCHIKWDPDPTPIIWFEVGMAQGRIHTYKKAGDSSLWIEGRIYFTDPFHFAARLCTPRQDPLNPSFPQFSLYEDPKTEPEEQLSTFSIETNYADRLTHCLDQTQIRVYLKKLRDVLKLNQCELILANQVMILRGCTKNAKTEGILIESYGPQIADLMKWMTNEMMVYASMRGTSSNTHKMCIASATPLGEEIWSCPSCSTHLNRSAYEILKGCCQPQCEETIDGIKDEVLIQSRPKIVMKEVDLLTLSSS